MKKLAIYLTILASLAVLMNPEIKIPGCRIKENKNISAIEKIVSGSKPVKYVSVDLGDTSDSYTLYTSLVENSKDTEFRLFTKEDFEFEDGPVPYLRVRKFLPEKIWPKISRIEDKLKTADILLFSGHHFQSSEILFSGREQHIGLSKYNVKAVFDFTKIPYNSDARLVILGSCFSVCPGSWFTDHIIMEKYPNAVVLGYESRCASGAGENIPNKQVIERFFDSLNENVLNISKEEIARRWVNAGKQYYIQRGEQWRELGAIWYDDGKICSINK